MVIVWGVVNFVSGAVLSQSDILRMWMLNLISVLKLKTGLLFMIISYGLSRATFSDIVFTHVKLLDIHTRAKGYIFQGALH